ncbi:flagellar export protein FliJ [Seleniivibrio woodruffii]|uniref:Flagellar FliJ protein n=1 Tax=Seleniivibrio woodruffii TaxID=1078050 RepID=A0A4R1K869_9BACT|nr:flagellar FliJ family protein [Seleniivibrio woodruffii]TCK60013.1 flagellar FliJ protein [Seleniivibrio woodruffii]TVZ35766.1 flagellar FliJ protein [Seleniivibrio woodruffii]
MKRQFRLQKVLEYRERVVEIEKGKLSVLNTRLLENRNRIMAVQAEIETKIAESDSANSAMRVLFEKYIKKLNEDKQQLIKVKRQIETGIEIQKKKVLESIERHKVMEKLKDKHIENFRAFLNKEEMKLIDELAISRSGRSDE